MAESLGNLITEIVENVKFIQERFDQLGYDSKKMVTSAITNSLNIKPQSQSYFGLYTAICVDTVDPWKQNRVRFFSPQLTEPNTKMKSCEWAFAISPFGGFDDSGVNWVPPAGSILCIMFESGHRKAPYYIGTTWNRDIGPENEHIWNPTQLDEYYRLYEPNGNSRRKGYLVGANDGSQNFPPWNTYNYNGIDIDSISDFENDPDAQNKATSPHLYGFKTPGKGRFYFDDGDYNCSHRWARTEWGSLTGNTMIMKDDHKRPCGQWAHPDCGCGPDPITDADKNDLTDCEDDPASGECTKDVQDQDVCANPFWKQESECRLFRGPKTPQNNRCQLPQSGIQIISVSGHSWYMDDSVEEPQGDPKWERSCKPFDFGCTDKFLGKTGWVSATGHRIEMSDEESDTKVRGENNYIRIISASGNKIELNDHTQGGREDCPPNLAGKKRGISMQTTSNHIFEMIDEENKQCSPARKEGGEPKANAKRARIRIKTGYGLEIAMKDDFSQEENGSQVTDQQSIQITAPQHENTDRGPHLMRFQEAKEGPGFVALVVGGNYIVTTYDNHETIVGDPDLNPADKVVQVTRDYVEITKENYVNKAKQHAFIADEKIFLMAGQDCNPSNGGEDAPESDSKDCIPCVWPALCLSPKGITVSDRVFVSASPDASCASIQQLVPFHTCAPFEGCTGGGKGS